ncbi:HD domain-containing protein [Peredibacter sp. HCB2-198]|uniref:HD domain-containing protein n=1 Tax=Peredibacter sp. HCB2-198 TaxID=3383025 RepID=UPI0038B4FDB9
MDKIQTLISFVRPYYNTPDPAHDWAHIGRVAKTARQLAEGLNVNIDCVLAGVYCHDLVNLPKDHPDRKNASTLAAKEARPLLEKSGFTPEEIAIVEKAIIEHSFSKGLKPSCLEAAIVQDADRLDALGAIGILRCTAVNTQMKANFYDPFDPLAEGRELNDKAFMIDHYYVKLYKLPEMMNTERGRKLGEERVAYMKTFINTLMGEIRG